MSEQAAMCKCGHPALEHYRGECTMIDARIMLFCPCKRFRRKEAAAAQAAHASGEEGRTG